MAALVTKGARWLRAQWTSYLSDDSDTIVKMNVKRGEASGGVIPVRDPAFDLGSLHGAGRDGASDFLLF
jgi:hypothetical protein